MSAESSSILSVLPRFNAARRYGWGLLAVGAVLAAPGMVLLPLALAQAPIPWASGVPAPPALGYFGAALWTAAAGFLSTAILTFGRQRLLAGEIGATRQPPVKDAAAGASSGEPTAAGRLVVRLAGWLGGVDLAGWPPPLIAMLLAVLTLGAVVQLWRLPPAPVPDPVALKIVAAGFLAAAFPLLVLERIFANIAGELLPEAPQLSRLLRVPLAASLALAAAGSLLSAGLEWGLLLERLLALLIAGVSLELALRCATVVFVPFAPPAQRQSLADSGLAGALLRLRVPSLRTLNGAVRRQLGIDLSRSWALAFIQRAALPVLLALGVLSWALTGMSALAINQRGIYERLGAPVAVFGPGLHVHLPWPLGRVRPVELGVVHLLPIEFVLPGGESAQKSSSIGEEADEQPVAADAPAPESADRLWTDDHPYEGSYIIASQENGRQSFQLVDIDMAVIYRIGATDAMARDAAYRVTDIDGLIQALAGRILVRYFTRNTLLDLLGRSREPFTREFRASLQAQLDRFSSGVEVAGISVEAIHPPPGAASAYHDVQAAQIRSTTRISAENGAASRTLESARREAGHDRDAALAGAAELVGQAHGQSIVFGGDRQAYARTGYPFLLERWLDDLGRALSLPAYVLIDHRLSGAGMPALDLRGPRASVSPGDALFNTPGSPLDSPADSGAAGGPDPSTDDDDRS